MGTPPKNGDNFPRTVANKLQEQIPIKTQKKLQKTDLITAPIPPVGKSASIEKNPTTTERMIIDSATPYAYIIKNETIKILIEQYFNLTIKNDNFTLNKKTEDLKINKEVETNIKLILKVVNNLFNIKNKEAAAEHLLKFISSGKDSITAEDLANEKFKEKLSFLKGLFKKTDHTESTLLTYYATCLDAIENNINLAHNNVSASSDATPDQNLAKKQLLAIYNEILQEDLDGKDSKAQLAFLMKMFKKTTSQNNIKATESEQKTYDTSVAASEHPNFKKAVAIENLLKKLNALDPAKTNRKTINFKQLKDDLINLSNNESEGNKKIAKEFLDNDIDLDIFKENNNIFKLVREYVNMPTPTSQSIHKNQRDITDAYKKQENKENKLKELTKSIQDACRIITQQSKDVSTEKTQQQSALKADEELVFKSIFPEEMKKLIADKKILNLKGGSKDRLFLDYNISALITELKNNISGFDLSNKILKEPNKPASTATHTSQNNTKPATTPNQSNSSNSSKPPMITCMQVFPKPIIGFDPRAASNAEATGKKQLTKNTEKFLNSYNNKTKLSTMVLEKIKDDKKLCDYILKIMNQYPAANNITSPQLQALLASPRGAHDAITSCITKLTSNNNTVAISKLMDNLDALTIRLVSNPQHWDYDKMGFKDNLDAMKYLTTPDKNNQFSPGRKILNRYIEHGALAHIDRTEDTTNNTTTYTLQRGGQNVANIAHHKNTVNGNGTNESVQVSFPGGINSTENLAIEAGAREIVNAFPASATITNYISGDNEPIELFITMIKMAMTANKYGRSLAHFNLVTSDDNISVNGKTLPVGTLKDIKHYSNDEKEKLVKLFEHAVGSTLDLPGLKLNTTDDTKTKFDQIFSLATNSIGASATINAKNTNFLNANSRMDQSLRRGPSPH
jgi:hypothetical protein